MAAVSATEQAANVKQELDKPTSQQSNDLKFRGFEFGSKGEGGNVPTIDDMEKELLSKLTPTLPRKNISKDDSGGKDSPKKVEKAASNSRSAKVCRMA